MTRPNAHAAGPGKATRLSGHPTDHGDRTVTLAAARPIRRLADPLGDHAHQVPTVRALASPPARIDDGGTW